MFCICLLPTTDCRELNSHYPDQTYYISVPKPAQAYVHAFHNKSGITCITAFSNFEIFVSQFVLTASQFVLTC